MIATPFEAPHIGGQNDLDSFSNKADGVKKIEVKLRKRPNWTTTFRWAIAHADDLRPAVNRQPGYRRVDSQNGCKQITINTQRKTNLPKQTNN